MSIFSLSQVRSATVVVRDADGNVVYAVTRLNAPFDELAVIPADVLTGSPLTVSGTRPLPSIADIDEVRLMPPP